MAVDHSTKTALELVALLMEHLRQSHPECDAIRTVGITPIEGPGAWRAEVVPIHGAVVSGDCYRAAAAMGNISAANSAWPIRHIQTETLKIASKPPALTAAAFLCAGR